MNELIPLYAWLRSKASIYVGQIEQLSIQQPGDGTESVLLRIQMVETLWGKPAQSCQFDFEQPATQTSRLKFPDPIWGRVTLQKGTRVLLVIKDETPPPATPLYVETITDPKNDVVTSIREVLNEMKAQRGIEDRVAKYLNWLTGDSIVQKLFAAESLAKDADFPESQLQQITRALADAFESRQDSYLRVNIGTWMIEYVYPRTTSEGKVAICNAIIRCANDPSEDIRRLSLDYLTTMDPADLKRSGVIKSAEAVRRLQERHDEETSPLARDQITKVLDAIRNEMDTERKY